MTPQRAKKLLPIIQHIAENGDDDLEYKNNTGQWVSASGIRLYETPERYRIKPKPVTRPWSKPEDVPGPVCWLMFPGGESLILGTSDSGIQYAGLDCVRTLPWRDLENVRHSTDRKTWHPCTVTEEPA